MPISRRSPRTLNSASGSVARGVRMRSSKTISPDSRHEPHSELGAPDVDGEAQPGVRRQAAERGRSSVRGGRNGSGCAGASPSARRRAPASAPAWPGGRRPPRLGGGAARRRAKQTSMRKKPSAPSAMEKRNVDKSRREPRHEAGHGPSRTLGGMQTVRAMIDAVDELTVVLVELLLHLLEDSLLLLGKRHLHPLPDRSGHPRSLRIPASRLRD